MCLQDVMLAAEVFECLDVDRDGKSDLREGGLCRNDFSCSQIDMLYGLFVLPGAAAFRYIEEIQEISRRHFRRRCGDSIG